MVAVVIDHVPSWSPSTNLVCKLPSDNCLLRGLLEPAPAGADAQALVCKAVVEPLVARTRPRGERERTLQKSAMATSQGLSFLWKAGCSPLSSAPLLWTPAPPTPTHSVQCTFALSAALGAPPSPPRVARRLRSLGPSFLLWSRHRLQGQAETASERRACA